MTMPLPIIPGLGAGEPEPALSLTAILDALLPEEVVELADAIAGGGEEDDDEEPDDAEEESEETLEEESEESPEEQEVEAATGLEDVGQLKAQVDEAVAESEELKAEFEGLVDEAAQNEDVGGDVKGIEKLGRQVEDLASDIEDHVEAFTTAADMADAEKAAKSGMQILECTQKLRGVLEQARSMAGANQSDEEPSEENPRPTLAVWASRYGQ